MTGLDWTANLLAGLTAMNKSAAEKPYTVLVDDNFNYMDESARTTHGDYATLEEAV
jgi:hypothetical protein